MTIEELNAIYEAADFGNQGNYTAPTTSNIDLTAPVVEGIPAIQPYMPPIIQNQSDGGNNFQDPPTNPMSFGQNDIPGYNQLNIAGPVKGPGILESLLSLPGQAMGAYMKYGPISQVKRGIEFVKEKQKERAIQKEIELQKEIEAAKAEAVRVANVQSRVDSGSYVSRDSSGMSSSDRAVGGGAGVASLGSSATDRGSKSEQGYSQHAKGGRIGYGKGGIVTL